MPASGVRRPGSRPSVPAPGPRTRIVLLGTPSPDGVPGYTRTMRILVNHIPEEHPEDALTIRQILERKGWNFPLLVVSVGGVLVERHQYDTFVVRDGADVGLLHLVSGG